MKKIPRTFGLRSQDDDMAAPVRLLDDYTVQRLSSHVLGLEGKKNYGERLKAPNLFSVEARFLTADIIKVVFGEHENFASTPRNFLAAFVHDALRKFCVFVASVLHCIVLYCISQGSISFEEHSISTVAFKAL